MRQLLSWKFADPSSWVTTDQAVAHQTGRTANWSLQSKGPERPLSTQSGRYLSRSLVSPVSETWLNIQVGEPRGGFAAVYSNVISYRADCFFSGPKPV